ncbi:PQQ-binding-like beta-propeller repeat protein [Hoyosella subflava]|uniref:Pyrrolo-quinoline quinone n=1 Tax=Hoyosella subflava (strain DSM 45089 / JCM 17490 / NBRC 109087 / DQS3-9A1) TaxID=443218 RepID=F6EPI1_HOYSD|nr:PQQ-binding-like beta-propeller repeat protein [Hoyosella subflava]AEF39414.1 hypothetical protein AS9A_0962 [Hoyosella subflava DQS3-9A1]
MAILGDVALLRDGAGETEAAIDLRTGALLWHRPLVVWVDMIAFDGRNVLFAGSDAVRAVELRTGSTAWELRHPDGETSPASIAVTDDGFALMSPGAMTAYN